MPSPSANAAVPENLYRGELMQYPGPWAFMIGHPTVIIVQDSELDVIADHPDQVIDLSLTHDKYEASLRQVCEGAQAAGQRTLAVAFDHFFHQYRPGQFEPRKLTPDSDDYIRRIAQVSRFAGQYGLALELSLLSPLEIGPAYAKATGESGFWMHYRKGVRDPKTGAFSVDLWRQKRWANNKGVVAIEDAGVRVFAFSERRLSGTPYRVVDPASIIEISDIAQVELLKDEEVRARIRIHGRGKADIGDRDRILAVQVYRTPEMDYFSPKALPYLTELVDKYADAGVKLNALYSDEMHIQQDWNYFGHHDHGQFALRYVSPGLAKEYARRHGSQYEDFAKWLVYFCYGQEDWAPDLSPSEGAMHVWGDTPEAVRETALFRSRYYQLLQDGVVDLFKAAKEHCEKRMGHRLETRAHATWAESPTIDYWRTGPKPLYQSAYEYTSDFIWSNTVHQAASACHDYFKWGEYLTGSGNDHCECGYADRNYMGLAMAASIGILNEIPYSYAAHWGLPNELSQRRSALVHASGGAGSPAYSMVQDMQHRDTEVLMLYPLDLVAVEERFGSWTTQYSYANYITQAKLLEMGKVRNGAIEIAGRRFTTLVATFEPFPNPKLLGMMKDLAASGGQVIWSGPPPVLSEDGKNIRSEWETLFGVQAPLTTYDGLPAPGKRVLFEGKFAALPPQDILTDYLVDHIFPVTPAAGSQVAARIKGQIVGTHRTEGKGSITYLGFRPRDDQSKSLGYEARTWFEILNTIGAYPGKGNPQALSRTTEYLCCSFPNGAVGIAPHFRETEEDWEGVFGRDAAKDAEYIKRCPPPPEDIALTDFAITNHRVTYTGRHCVTFRADASGNLIAFAGQGSRRITIDGKETVFADREMAEIGWAPVPSECRVKGGAILRIYANGYGTLSLPVLETDSPLAVYAEGSAPGRRGERLEAKRDGNRLIFTLPEGNRGRWFFAAMQ